MLYIAFPHDLRDRYADSVWLVYSKQVTETTFDLEDTLVLSEWVVQERAELMQIAVKAKQQGARVIYVGPSSSETKEFKRQLCLINVYDFAFFSDEIVLGVLDEIIENPRSPADVREYIDKVQREENEMPPVVEIIEEEAEEEQKESRINIGRLKRIWTKQQTSSQLAIHTVKPQMVIVMQLWPRSGTSFVAMNLSYLMAKRLTQHCVSLIEAPGQLPRLFDYFGCEKGDYVHWTEDGRGECITVHGVDLIPLPRIAPTTNEKADEALARFLFRQMRRPFNVVDAGSNVSPLLLDMADFVVVVMDADPTLFSQREHAEAYRSLIDNYGTEKVWTVLNKWTKSVDFSDPSNDSDLFRDSINLPYMDPEAVQKALWEGVPAAKMSELSKQFSIIEKRIVSFLIDTKQMVKGD